MKNSLFLLQWHETFCHIPLKSDNISSLAQLCFLGAVLAFHSTFCLFGCFADRGVGPDLIRCASSGSTLQFVILWCLFSFYTLEYTCKNITLSRNWGVFSPFPCSNTETIPPQSLLPGAYPTCPADPRLHSLPGWFVSGLGKHQKLDSLLPLLNADTVLSCPSWKQIRGYFHCEAYTQGALAHSSQLTVVFLQSLPSRPRLEFWGEAVWDCLLCLSKLREVTTTAACVAGRWESQAAICTMGRAGTPPLGCLEPQASFKTGGFVITERAVMILMKD